MLSFFKINDPYRVIFVFLGLIAAWVVAILSNPLTTPELSWMVIGERLGHGNVLYRDLWTEYGPFSAGVYWLLDVIFGRSHSAYMVIALLLVFEQSFIFNRMLLTNGSLSQPAYVPALVYACLSILSFDFMTLSPQLMANTFLILALELIFEHTMARMKYDEKIQYIGLFLAIATLFYLPYFIFLIGFIVVLLIFTGTVVRRFLLIAYGFFLPLVMVGIYYWYRDGFQFFWNQFILSDFFQKEDKLMSTSSLLIVAALPALFLLFSILKLFGRIRYTNFQITLIQVIVLLIVFAGVGYWLSPTKPPHALLIFLPFAAFMICHLFMLIQRKLLGEFLFLAFLALIVLWNWGTCFGFSPTQNWIDYSRLKVQPSKWDNLVEGKKVMVLADDINVLNKCELSTPFLTWRVSSEVFLNPDQYSNIVLVFKYITKEKPEIIIDPRGVMADFFSKMPTLKTRYMQRGEFWVRQPEK